MHVLDQLLAMLAVVIGALLVISLIAHQVGKPARDTPSSRSRVVAGITRWLAVRLAFFWLLVLIVRLALSI